MLGILFILCAFVAPRPIGDELQAGLWIEVRGALDDEGLFVASAVEVHDPDDEVLLGTITDVRRDGTRVICLGQEVHISEETTWVRTEPGLTVGERVKIQGRYHGPRKFSADSIARRGAGRDRLLGPIDEVEGHERGTLVRMLRYRVLIPTEVEIESERPLSSYDRSTPRTPAPLFQSVRERDDDDDIRGRFRLVDEVTLGVRTEWNYELEDNYNLREGDPEDRQDNELTVRAEAIWRPNDSFYGLVGYRGSVLFRDREDESFDTIDRSRLSEFYGYFEDVGFDGLDVQAGRQDFDDPREWIYDQNLDAVRVVLDRPDWRAELSASTTLSNGSPRDEASDNLIAYLTNQSEDALVGAYIIDRRDDRSPRDYPLHFGLRALGEWLPDQDVWAELSMLRGYMGNIDLKGYAWDIGTTWKPDCLGGVYLTGGWAFASGDDNPADTEDDTFRQTGLQDNNAKWGGVTSFKYYGELLDPELSNLSILSLGVGLRLGRRSSLDLVLHTYTQDSASTALLNTNIDRAPDGIHRDIGHEIDLIFGSRALDDIDVEVVLSAFEPGDAFPATSTAYFAKFQLRYRF